MKFPSSELCTRGCFSMRILCFSLCVYIIFIDLYAAIFRQKSVWHSFRKIDCDIIFEIWETDKKRLSLVPALRGSDRIQCQLAAHASEYSWRDFLTVCSVMIIFKSFPLPPLTRTHTLSFYLCLYDKAKESLKSTGTWQRIQFLWYLCVHFYITKNHCREPSHQTSERLYLKHNSSKMSF